MAEVFLSMVAGPLGSGFSKLAVVKRLRPNLVEDPDFIAMLVDEARISARLNHPNVVQTLEVDVDAGEYFIAMEFLDGQPLHRILRRAARTGVAISSEHQYVVIADVLAGLEHAHDLSDYDGTPLGIVHRDVTPQNIFVTYNGQVKVVDFGIAKAKGRISETRQGIVKGKVRYMSPEQAIGQPVDRRSDVFAAGVLLWEAATGTPFWGEVDELAIVQALVAGEYQPSPRALVPSVPVAIDAICRRALAYQAADRYASASELRADLEAFLANDIVRARRTLGPLVAELFAKERQKFRTVIEQTSKRNVETMSIAALPPSRVMQSTSSADSAVEPIAIASISPVMMSAPPPALFETEELIEDGDVDQPVASRARFDRSDFASFASMLVAIVIAITAVRTLGVTRLTGIVSSLGNDGALTSARAPAEPVAMRTRLTLRSTPLRKHVASDRAGAVLSLGMAAPSAAPSAPEPSASVEANVPAPAPAPSATAPPPPATRRGRAKPAIDTADPWSAAK